jgi:hypothetical protein
MIAVALHGIARNGERLASSVSFDDMTPSERIKLLKNIPSIKADREFKAFVLKLKRKLRIC